MKTYHSISHTVSFMLCCIIFSSLVSYAFYGLSGLSWNEGVSRIGFYIAISLYAGARLYPVKIYDTRGYIQGMHRDALVVAAICLFGAWATYDPVMNLSEHENAIQGLSWSSLIALLIAVFVYWLMDWSLRETTTCGDKKQG